MKPVLFIVLLGVAIYTLMKKNFGQQEATEIPEEREMLYAVMISSIIGFYDGFIGPGTGTFLILAMIYFLGFDFLRASAHAKLVNLATNIGSIMLFTFKGKIIWMAAVPMAVCNAIGGLLGARLAISKGNRLIRIFFMLIVMATLARLGWDLLKK